MWLNILEFLKEQFMIGLRKVFCQGEKSELLGGLKSADIQKWVNDKLNNDSIENKEIDSEYYSPLSSKRVIIKNKYTKNNALNDLIDLISASPQVIDKNLLREELLKEKK